MEQKCRVVEYISGVRTWMLILEFGQVVDVFIHNDPEIIGLVMRGDIALRESLYHLEI